MRLPLAALAVPVLAASGCGSTTTIVRTVTQPPSASTATTTSDAPDSDGARPEPTGDQEARVGDGLTIEGQETTLFVRVSKVLDPLPAGTYDEAEPGHRFVGVRIAVRNDGDVAYSDSVSNGSSLVLRGDEQADPTLVSGGPCGNSFSSSVRIAPGDQRVGCIAFEVPVGKALRSYQFTPDSGFADATGEWRITRTSGGGDDDASLSSAGTSSSSASGRMRACDANISASAGTTSCPFAENAFYEYYVSGEASHISAYSPATGRRYGLTCFASGADVECSAADGAVVRFSQAAVDAYSDAQAQRYAATHDNG